jgi:N-acetylglucosamine-6-phosphate deacetylase
LRPIDLRALESLLESSRGHLRVLTLAPELPGALEAIRMSVAHDVVVSAGHTEATAEDMERAFEQQLSMVTHATNAMPKEVDGGLLRAVTEHSHAVAGVIADGIHVEPERLQSLYRALGPQRMMLVTDAAPPAGMPDGSYTLGEVAVEKKGGAVRLRGKDTLAGSALTMDQAVVNSMRFLGIDVEDAVLMASATPAKAAAIGGRGEIARKHRADFVILDPRTLAVKETIVGGVTRFDAAAREMLGAKR